MTRLTLPQWEWYLFAAADVLRVLVYELVHLCEAHHGPAFWPLLARVMPGYEEGKRGLARRGARLWFGGTS